jgi:hypothetical protein
MKGSRKSPFPFNFFREKLGTSLGKQIPDPPLYAVAAVESDLFKKESGGITLLFPPGWYAPSVQGEKIPPQQSVRVFMWLRAASDDGFDNFIL